MNYWTFLKTVQSLESSYLAAVPYIPRNSNYFAWGRKLLEGTLTQDKAIKLRNRLDRFERENTKRMKTKRNQISLDNNGTYLLFKLKKLGYEAEYLSSYSCVVYKPNERAKMITWGEAHEIVEKAN
jgi:hypothetical protein